MNCRTGAVLLGFALALSVAGCGMSGGDPRSLIAKAQDYRAKQNHKAAIIELKNLLQKDNNHAEARYLLGMSYYDSRDFRAAEQELRRALDLNFERSKVMPALGKTMLVMGEFQKVLDQVRVEESAGAAVQAEILMLRARAFFGLRQWDQARDSIGQALAKQPEYADALLESARLAGVERKMDEAARLVDRAIASAPKHIDAWLMKGDLARLRADRDGMLAANQTVLEIDANNVAARLNVASLHVSENKLDDARKLIGQAHKLAPDNLHARHMQALIDFRARDYKAANETIQQVLKVAPNYMPSVMLAGAIATELGAYEQAQVHLGSVLERAPNNLYARKLLLTALARSGQTQRALEVLQTGLKQAPEDAQLMSLAGELYLQNGEFAKASEHFDKAAKLDPKNALARSKLGVSRLASGDTERAFSDLESAVAIDSSKYQTDMVLIVSHLRRGSYDQALKAMESLEKKQPNNPVTHNLKAVIYLGKKDIPSARKGFERALELQPTFLAAAKNLAQIDIQEKNPKAARARLEGVLEKDRSNAPALIALAELGPALGATQKEQVEWLERARKVNPQALQPLAMLARLYFQTGEPKKALEIAQQAQAASPDSPQLLDILGAAQTNAGEKEQALVTYRKLVKLQPKSPAALFKLANAQAIAGEFGAAEDSLNQALALNPNFVDALAALVPLHLRAKRYPDALKVAQQVQKQAPKAPAGFVLEGDVLMTEKKFPQAARAYETALGMAKNSASMLKLHAANTLAGKPEEADARLTQWLKEFPEDVAIRVYAAESAMKRGNHKDAISQYEWLRQKQPDNVLVLNNLAWAYFQTKDARALETAERAYKLAPDNPSVSDTLGIQLVQTGNVKRGLELLEKAAKAAPNVPEIRFHLAQAWIKVGEKSKARGELERALSINEKFSNHVEALNLLKELRQ